MQPPFNHCTYMRVCLPKAELTDNEGDNISYAVIEVGDSQGVKFNAQPTVEFTLTDIIPIMTAANISVAVSDVGLTILHP